MSTRPRILNLLGFLVFHHKLSRNVLSNYSVMFIRFCLAVFLTPFYVHRLGAAGFGIWILLNTVFSYFHLLEWGIMPSVVRHVSDHHARNEQKEIQTLFMAVFSLLLLISIISLPLIYATSRLGPIVLQSSDSEATIFMSASLFMGGATIFDYFNRLYQSVCKGHERYDLLNLSLVTSQLTGIFLKVMLVLKGYGLPGLAVAHFIQSIIQFVILAMVLNTSFGIVNPWFAPMPLERIRNKIGYISSYTNYSALNAIAYQISHRLDAVVIGIFLPVQAITSFEIGKRISDFLEKIVSPITDLFFPLAANLNANRDASLLPKLLIEGSRMAVMIVSPVLIIVSFHAAKLIGLWIGKAYVAGSLPVVYLLLAAAFISVFEATASRILIGVGRVRFDARLSIITAGVNLGLSLLLVRPYGIAGVAMGTLISTSLSHIFFSVPYTCKVTGTSVIQLYGKTFLPALLIGVVSLSFMLIMQHLISSELLAAIVDLLFVLTVSGALIINAVRSPASQTLLAQTKN